jgi:uncharacterized membrane protein
MSHHPTDIFDDTKKFQLERMILFSDAVFAIAITLLIIEIKVPELHDYTDKTINSLLTHALAEKATEFIGFIVSFVVIGQFWTQHHKLFGLVQNYDNKLIWLNMHMLLWIVIVPFSNALNFKYGTDPVWMWYSFNMFMIGLSLFSLWNYICKPGKKLSHIANDPLRARAARVRSIVVAFIFLLGLLLCIPGNKYTSGAARFIYCLIFPAMLIVNRMYKFKK